MHTSVAFLLELGVVLTVIGLLGTAARRFGLSPVPLYLMTGLLLGDGGLAGVPAARQFVETGATIGVVLLLLVLGLEFSTTEFFASVRRHLRSSILDALANAVPGVLAGWLLGFDWVGMLALAGVTWVSSSGIVARLLGDLRRLGNRETPAVLAVLVLEDFAMAAYLPVLTVLAAGGSWWNALLGVAAAVGAVLIAVVASHRWAHHVGRLIDSAHAEPLMLRVLGATLIVAALAEFVHVSAAVGAFLIGLALTGELADRARVVIAPLRDLFAAAFFLAIGFSVSVHALLPVLPAALALAAATAVTKIATGWYAAARDGSAFRGPLRAGTALIARGEFSIVIAGLLGAAVPGLAPLATAYVLMLAIAGPVLTRLVGGVPQPVLALPGR